MKIIPYNLKCAVSTCSFNSFWYKDGDKEAEIKHFLVTPTIKGSSFNLLNLYQTFDQIDTSKIDSVFITCDGSFQMFIICKFLWSKRQDKKSLEYKPRVRCRIFVLKNLFSFFYLTF